MKNRVRISLVGIILLVLLITLGCSLIPDSLGRLKDFNPFSKPTSTATITPTPKAPLQIGTCPDLDCPDAIPADELLGFPADDRVIYPVTVPDNVPVNFSLDWTVLDEDVLNESLPAVKWVFTIDGQDYFREDLVVLKPNRVEDDPEWHPAAWLSVNLSGWKIGEPHVIGVGLVLQEDASDGWVDLPAGHTYIKQYKILPINPPTATATFNPMDTPTPQATLTSTPKPTLEPTLKPVATLAPLKPTATQNLNLKYDMTMKVENKCAEQHVVVATGPIRLKFTVPPGQTVEWQAPQGTYSWMIDNTYPGGPQDLNTNVWTLTLCQ